MFRWQATASAAAAAVATTVAIPLLLLLLPLLLLLLPLSLLLYRCCYRCKVTQAMSMLGVHSLVSVFIVIAFFARLDRILELAWGTAAVLQKGCA